MDVIKGRKEFNFSDWKKNPGELDEMIENILDGEMPPIQYLIFHPGSKMNDRQKQVLIDALQSSIR